MAVKAGNGSSAGAGGGPDDSVSGALDGLLARVACGDEEAFAAVYDHIAGSVFGLVHGIAGDADRAQKMTEEVLIRVWRSASRFNPSAGSGLSWVLGLTRQYVADQREDTADGRPGSAGDQGRSRGRRGADTVLGGLPETQQRAVVLAVYDGRTVDEIGERLGVPRGEAMALLRSGLLKVALSGNR